MNADPFRDGPPLPGQPFNPAGPTLAPLTPWSQIDPASVPRISFVYADTYAAGYVTVTFAAPKTGKSLLAMAESIDAATASGILTGRRGTPRRTLYYNAEDDQDILNARTLAVLAAHGISQDAIEGRFFAVSGIAENRSLVLIRGERNEVNEPAFEYLRAQIEQHRIELAIFDPLQDLSQSPESNEAFRALGGRLRRLASDTGVALGLVHHTRKPTAGAQATLDDGRGGSALRGVARFNRLLLPMTEAQGAEAAVDDFRLYFRIAEAESNLAPPSSDRNRWFKKIGVEIGNGGTYPTLEPWKWPDAFAGVKVEDARRVRAAIAKRASDGNPCRENIQASDWAGKVVAEVLALDLNEKPIKGQVKKMLAKWIETGVLRVESLKTPKGKGSPHVFPGPNDPGVVSVRGAGVISSPLAV